MYKSTELVLHFQNLLAPVLGFADRGSLSQSHKISFDSHSKFWNCDAGGLGRFGLNG
jgi:hypothetical protein